IVKARPRLSSTPSSSAQGGTGAAAAAAAAANPFASLASSSSSSAAAPAAPNPFQNVVLSTKPAASASAPAPAATPEGEPVSANGGSSSKPSPTAKATDGDASSPSPASTETPSSATPKEAAVTAADEAPAAPATSGESPKDKEEAAATAAAAPSEAGRKEAEDSAGKPKEDAEQKKDVAEGSAAAAPAPAAAVEEGAKEAAVDAEKGEKKPAATATAGVVSFAALGGVGGSTPFQSLGTSTSTVGGAAPLTFSGFGSASGPLSSLGGAGVGLSLPGAASTTLNGGTTTAPAASAPGPVLSFGSSTGTTGAFSSFTSFAAAPAVGGGWGSPPKDGVKKEGDGAGASGGAADGEKKDGGGAAGGARVSSDVNTKPPIELMDPSEVVNGEELEECTHKARGKLFRLVNKEWVEMGIGHLKVKRKALRRQSRACQQTTRTTQKQMVLEALLCGRGSHPPPFSSGVMINLGLQAQTKCSAQGEKALLLTFFTPEGPATYLLKTPEIAGSLKNAIDVLLPKPTEEEESAA
ncbi:unnamed protein product, partial [Scytosiphon promiscuus]